jgi:hypothetical protein
VIDRHHHLRWRRRTLAVLILVVMALAMGHEGYVTRLEDEPVEDYRLTLLDDLHNGSGIVLIFLEYDGAPAPADTQVSVLLRPLGGDPFDIARADYSGDLYYLERERAMFLASPIILQQADVYLLEVFISGAGGQGAIEVEVLPAQQDEL